jgi:hypothetical protein
MTSDICQPKPGSSPSSPPTAYDIPPTSFLFNNIPALCSNLLYYQ